MSLSVGERTPLVAIGLAVVGALVVLAALVVTRVDLLQADDEPTTVLLTGQAQVPAGQIADAVLVGRGTAVVLGEVEGDVLVVDGRVRIDGVVGGTVTVLRGDAVLGPEAVVAGDLRTSQTPRINARATVAGTTSTVGLTDLPGLFPRSIWVALWAGAGLAVLALLMAAPRTAHRRARALATRPVRAVGAGVVVAVAGPVLVAVLLASVLGSVVAVVVAAALVLAAAGGAAVSAATVGRLALAGRGRGPLVLGWLLLGLVVGLALLLSPPAAVGLGAVLAAIGAGGLVLGHGEDVEASGPPSTEATTADQDLPPWWPEAPAHPPTAETTAAAPPDDGPRVLAALPILDGDERRMAARD